MNLLAGLHASFLADALSLGPHWIYNQAKVARLYPDGVRDFDDPRSNFHPNRRAGDLTHYGDQAMTLLRAVALSRGWDPAGWRDTWWEMWDGYDGFLDKATMATLENLEKGVEKPSESDEIGGAARMGPVLLALEGEPLDARVKAARSQATLTHGDPAVADSAEFFTRVLAAIEAGSDVADALDQAAGAAYAALAAKEGLAKARAVADDDDPAKAAAGLGLTCHMSEAFPCTLLFLLRHPGDLEAALSENALAGGDTSSRAMLIGLVLGATLGFAAIPGRWMDGLSARHELAALVTLLGKAGKASSRQVKLTAQAGHELDARLDLPGQPPRAFALFAHCFTCGKNSAAATRLGRALAEEGIATLRFDFTGLGSSEGDFADTSFLTNVDDLLSAADFLRREHEAPVLLLGHSLGGAAALAAASRIPECRGLATVGAPFDPGHVTHLFEGSINDIREKGQAKVKLAGREFEIGTRFLDDVAEHCQPCEIEKLERDLLIMHAPDDEIVSIGHAGKIYSAARHPKSFVSLAGADHLLTKPGSAAWAARVIAAWATRFL